SNATSRWWRARGILAKRFAALACGFPVSRTRAQRASRRTRTASFRGPSSNGDLGNRDRRFRRPDAARGRPAPAPRMSENQLYRHGDPAVALRRFERLDEARPAAPARQRAAAAGRDIRSTAGAQIPDQRVHVLVRQLQSVYVDDRLGKARLDGEIAEIVHIEERVDVHAIVDRGPSATHLEKRIGTERCEQQKPAAREYPRRFAEYPVRPAPREQHISQNQIGLANRERQALGVGRDY